MAVALSESEFAKLSPEARAQLGGERVTKTREPARPEPTTPRPPGRDVPKRSGKPGPVLGARPSVATGGVSERTRTAVGTTRDVYRASGSGRTNATPRGVLWAFVWIGVFGYLLAHPATVPRLVQLVFAPVNGVLQVAHGKNVNLAQHPAG
jgi:hypothetical protein